MAEGFPESLSTWILGGLTTLFGAAGTVISFLYFRAETANGKTLEIVQSQQAETEAKLTQMAEAHKECEEGKAELDRMCAKLDATCSIQATQIATLQTEVAKLRQA